MVGNLSLITNTAHFSPYDFFIKSLHLYFGSFGYYLPATVRLKKKNCDKIYITAIQEEIKTFYNFYFSFFFLGDRVVAEVGSSNRICL